MPRDRKYNCQLVVNTWGGQLSQLGMLRSGGGQYVDCCVLATPREKGADNYFNFYSEVEESADIFRCFLIIPRLGLGHHHFTELVKIHGARAILQKDNDVLQNIFSNMELFSYTPTSSPRPIPQWFLPAPHQSGGRAVHLCGMRKWKLQIRNVCRTNQAPQGLGCDEALALLVVDPEGVLQLLLHRLHVRVLDQEGGTQLAELTCGRDLFNLMSRL